LDVRVDTAEADERGEVERLDALAADHLRRDDPCALDDVRRREHVTVRGDAVLEAELLLLHLAL